MRIYVGAGVGFAMCYCSCGVGRLVLVYPRVCIRVCTCVCCVCALARVCRYVDECYVFFAWMMLFIVFRIMHPNGCANNRIAALPLSQ